MRKTWKTAFAGAFAAALLAGAMLILPACSNGAGSSAGSAAGNGDASEVVELRSFTDSLGREVRVPVSLDHIAALSSTSEQILITMAPNMMVGLCQAMSEDERRFLGDELAALPVLGSYFNAKGDFNRESVAAAGPQVIIDMGEPKSGLAEDLDALSRQLAIPVVFIETSLDNYGTAYRMLGDLLGLPERGEQLASYCEAAYADTLAVVDAIPAGDRVNMLYLLGDAGLNIIPAHSFQSGVIDLVANNLAEVENAKGGGQGMESSLEQIALWDPELIVFGPNSIYGTVAESPAWKGIDAIDAGQYFEVPSEPYSWLNNPPTVNQILGLQWLARVCYPQAFADDLKQVVTEYYQLFYAYELTDEEYIELTQGALPLIELTGNPR